LACGGDRTCKEGKKGGAGVGLFGRDIGFLRPALERLAPSRQLPTATGAPPHYGSMDVLPGYV